MKRIIILLLALWAFSLTAQDITFNKKDITRFYKAVASDTLGSDSALVKTIWLQDIERYNYIIEADADSSGDASSIVLTLYGSIDNSEYTSIGSITWTGDVDTTFKFSNLVDFTQSIITDAFNVTADTVGLSGYFADTLAYPQQTQTVTSTKGGVYWDYLKLTWQGSSSSSDMALRTTGRAIRIKILRIIND